MGVQTVDDDGRWRERLGADDANCAESDDPVGGERSSPRDLEEQLRDQAYDEGLALDVRCSAIKGLVRLLDQRQVVLDSTSALMP
jgi:hypothetical protein